MKRKRSYAMGVRAQAVEETRRKILDATFELTRSAPIGAITLEHVAGEAGVSVQTVLRQFGGRAGLFEAALAHADALVVEERRAPVGDVAAAVAVVVDHYELRGDWVLLLLAQEATDEQVRGMTEVGKATHRRWVQEVFAPYVAGDVALVDLLVVATDVYTWKLLRRDRGLSRALTERRMKRLVAAIVAATEGAKEKR